MIITPYERGWIAHCRGDTILNPYKAGTEAFEDWEQGYKDEGNNVIDGPKFLGPDLIKPHE
jgi:hypothetical protein